MHTGPQLNHRLNPGTINRTAANRCSPEPSIFNRDSEKTITMNEPMIPGNHNHLYRTKKVYREEPWKKAASLKKTKKKQNKRGHRQLLGKCVWLSGRMHIEELSAEGPRLQ